MRPNTTLQLPLQGWTDGVWEHSHTISAACASTHRELMLRDINILHAQAEPFHQAQAAAVQQTGDQPRHAIELRNTRACLVARPDHRHPRRTWGTAM